MAYTKYPLDLSSSAALCHFLLAAFFAVIFLGKIPRRLAAAAIFFASLAAHIAFANPGWYLLMAACAMGYILDEKFTATCALALALQIPAILVQSSHCLGSLYAVGFLGAARFFPFSIGDGNSLPNGRDVILGTLLRSSYLLSVAVALPPILDHRSAVFQSLLTASFMVLLLHGERFPWRVIGICANFTMALSFTFSQFKILRSTAIFCFFATAVSALPFAILLPGDATLGEANLKGLIAKNKLRGIFIAFGWISMCISPALAAVIALVRPLALFNGIVTVALICVAVVIFFQTAVRMPTVLSLDSEVETAHGELAKKLAAANISLCIAAFAISVSIFLAVARTLAFKLTQ
ncbi:MAG: hypothetical protein LBB38_00405 [Puniceicoccales bacterium]|jgi:hypothetical protein|nr:hypothetical protein [Puniceicoccales bacterium]